MSLNAYIHTFLLNVFLKVKPLELRVCVYSNLVYCWRIFRGVSTNIGSHFLSVIFPIILLLQWQLWVFIFGDSNQFGRSIYFSLALICLICIQIKMCNLSFPYWSFEYYCHLLIHIFAFFSHIFLLAGLFIVIWRNLVST